VEDRGLSAYLAELVGTFLLVLFIALIVSVYTLGAAAGPSATKLAGFSFSGSNFAVIGLLHAFVLMMLIQTLGGTSGGHFNPAVTLGLASVRQIKAKDAGIYIVVQVIGAIAGAALCKLILDDIGGSPGLIEPSLGNPHVSALLDGKTALGALCELAGAFALVWSVMGVAVNPRGLRNWAGFVIGATLGFGVMAFGPLTGGSLNPARARAGDRGRPLRRGLRPLRRHLHNRPADRRRGGGGGLQAAGARPPGAPRRRAHSGRGGLAGRVIDCAGCGAESPSRAI
jgi:glycerol uptake facilitator protein